LTSKTIKIGLILVLMGIGTLAAYSINSFNPITPEGIILFDLLIAFLLTMSSYHLSRNFDRDSHCAPKKTGAKLFEL
jgi:hypothetical protein